MVKMANAFESALRACFCCCPQGDADETDAPYDRLRNDESHATSPNVNIVRPRGFDNRGIHDDLIAVSPANNASAPPRNRQEEQEQALTSIINQTQTLIIDVAHLEDAEIPSGEFLARQRDYEEAIKAHDVRAQRAASLGAGGSSAAVNSAAIAAAERAHALLRGSGGGRLLDDCGNRVQDWLGRPPISKNRRGAATAAAVRVDEAVKSLKVVPKGPLVAFMDLD